LLAGLVIVATMGLTMASRFDQRSTARSLAVAPELVIDPNTAPARVLTALPHVGPALIREWIAAREDRPFTSLEDARDRVRGLGPATLAQLAPYLRLEPSSQADASRIASSGPDRPAGKSRSTRRKPTRSKSASLDSKSTPRAVAKSPEPETRPMLSVARHD
jgi:competence protein ComEA